MNINYRCLRELEIKGLFETPEHRSRFSELLNCYCNYPFFNKGLCKCMYLSSWDMEHFIVMLDILNDMTIGKNQNLQLMEDNGKVLENMSDGYDRYIFQLASAFLTSQDFQITFFKIHYKIQFRNKCRIISQLVNDIMLQASGAVYVPKAVSYQIFHLTIFTFFF